MKALVLDPYLVRDIIPIIVKGLHPILLGQKQDGQVVAGSAGKQEDHCCSQCCCTPHCGPLVRLKNKNKVSLEYCQNTDIPIALYGSILAFLCPASHFFLAMLNIAFIHYITQVMLDPTVPIMHLSAYYTDLLQTSVQVVCDPGFGSFKHLS